MPRFSSDKRQRPYWRENGLLGKTFRAKLDEQILVIGKDTWTRQEIVDKLHCGNFVAAANLTKVAHKLQVESLAQLVSRFTLNDLFQERGVGVTTVWVLLCAQEDQQKDPLKWVDQDADDHVTLGTEKHRARKQQEEARKQKRARSSPRS